MISSASRSIAWRRATDGNPRPTTCSLSRSPDPTPRVKRSCETRASVAAAWAMTAGWYRIVGQVTPLTSPIRSVRAAIAPNRVQLNGLWPWTSSQGWKWSLISTKSKPTSSARTACRMISSGPNASVASL
ncbi:hypothetical protein GCM10010210_10740 [Pseudonocardia hydrocarbonoxydans]|uniref:Uncharacterized protein n=1 Tax=Pseudonocardia hydrocarbonoxydans TaxID=76726 RepID=A0A4Y3WS14_9PSEU|nr:hypothetical protein PHY01_35910 [Pseudonocardia hydrocarbonoxydans]